MSWAGIDVGGRRKGFHGAAVDGTKVIKGPHRLGGVDEMMRWLFAIEPEVVALDSPKTCARRGERSRECERELMKAICGIRWTPEAAELEGNKYYEWIRCGRELYEALKRETSRRGWQVIESSLRRRGPSGRARGARRALFRPKCASDVCRLGGVDQVLRAQ